MNRVVELLTRYGPSLTPSLASRLQEQGLSNDAARQALSRLPEEVRVLGGLPFPKKARFLFLEKQFGTEPYWKALISAVNDASPAYSSALAAMRARGGIIPARHFDIVCGAPVKQKRHLSADVICERLKTVMLLSSLRIEGIGECVSIVGSETGTAQLRARLMTEQVLLDSLRRWAVSLNMASAKQTKVRDESSPQFATFRFDLCGPCYLRPLHRWKDNKLDAGFFVADVLVGRTLGEEDVSPFLRKCSTLGHLRGIRPFLPMLIADGFTPEALRKCRSEGIIATRPESLFGEDAGRALSDLLQTLTNAAAVAASDPERIEKLFNSLTKIEGSAGNLRGALFEVIVGHLVRTLEGGSIDIGELVLDIKTGQRAEMDVRLVKEKHVVVYECKGHQSSATVGKREIETWLKKKVPIIAAAHRQQQRFDGGSLRFEFWTCGGFDDETVALLANAKQQTGKYDIAWRDGSAINEYARQLSSPGIKKILSEHYFSHPTTKLLGTNNSQKKAEGTEHSQ